MVRSRRRNHYSSRVVKPSPLTEGVQAARQLFDTPHAERAPVQIDVRDITTGLRICLTLK